MNTELHILFGLLAVTAVASLDAFSAAFAYSASGIRVPLSSLSVIAGICGIVTGLAFGAGGLLGQYDRIFQQAGSYLLLVLGLLKLAEGYMKHRISQMPLRQEISFSALDIRFILAVYADPVQADADSSGSLTAREAIAVALALSADGFLSGLGYGLGGLPVLLAVLAAVGINLLFLLAGRAMGQRLAGRLRFPDWLASGLILTAAALIKLI